MLLDHCHLGRLGPIGRPLHGWDPRTVADYAQLAIQCSTVILGLFRLFHLVSLTYSNTGCTDLINSWCLSAPVEALWMRNAVGNIYSQNWRTLTIMKLGSIGPGYQLVNINAQYV